MGKPQKHVLTYRPRQPENSALYKVLAEHVETFIAQRENDGKGVPEFVIKEIRGFLGCGISQDGFLRTKCKACDYERAVPGLITLIQRFGSVCNLNIHFHLIALEGVYMEPETDEGIPRFARFEPPTDQDVCDVAEKIAVNAIKLLTKKGCRLIQGFLGLALVHRIFPSTLSFAHR